MITILVTFEDGKTSEFKAEHINLRAENGVTKDLKTNTLAANGQSRFNITGWTGIDKYQDFTSDAEINVNI
jgi:hypothetical protein